MSHRDKSWRIAQTDRIQSKRIKNWTAKSNAIGQEKHKGMMRKTHFGCGCKMCKPWKHFGDNKHWESNIKHSDLKRMYDYKVHSMSHLEQYFAKYGWGSIWEEEDSYYDYGDYEYDDWKRWPYASSYSTGGMFLEVLVKLDIIRFKRPGGYLHTRYSNYNYINLLEKLSTNKDGIVYSD